MTRLQLRWVDVFTDRALAGNPLAVVLDADGLGDSDMQAIAREMNLSETTFVLKPVATEASCRLRIFTPRVELPFAGHPTIGTAWVLDREGRRPGGADMWLEEGVGLVRVTFEDGSDGRIWLHHPPVQFLETAPAPTVVLDALGLAEADWIPQAPMQICSTGNPFLYVAVRDRGAVDRAAPDAARLAKCLAEVGPHAVFLFAPDGPGHLYSRMFAPHVGGLAEDPATGSASGPLGAYAVRYGLAGKAAELELVSEQGVKMGRPSQIVIRLRYEESEIQPAEISVGGSVRPLMTMTMDL